MHRALFFQSIYVEQNLVTLYVDKCKISK